MKKSPLILFFLVNVTLHSSAQITFIKYFGGTAYEWGMAGQQTTDGGYVIFGETKSFGGSSGNVYLIKTDAIGDTMWTKTFGGTLEDGAISGQQTTDGGYIIVGGTQSYGAGDWDVYLIKTDASGNALWSKTYGRPNDDRGYSIQQTFDGGYIIAGHTTSTGLAGRDNYLIKTDVNGDTLWTRIFNGYDNICNSVRQTSDGGYIITGYNNNSDVFLQRIDANGDTLWAKTYGAQAADYGYAAKQTSDGGFIIVGNTESFASVGTEVYLIKTDANGTMLWSKILYVANNYNSGKSVQQTSDGGFIITGYAVDDVYLIKTDSNGDALWSKSYGVSGYDDHGESVQQTTDGGYIITGWANSFGAGNNDIILIKTDSLGNSGCNQSIPPTIVSTPATIEYNYPMTVSSGGTIGNPLSVVNRGGVITTLCLSVGTKEIVSNNLFNISPNPSNGNFMISFKNKIRGTIKISNTLGENIYEENIFNESTKEVKLKDITDGIYFVRIFSGEKYYCRKIIVGN